MALVAGGAVPVAARLGNPYIAYGIVLVSFPAWALGTLSAAIVAARAARRDLADRGVMLWGLILGAGNLVSVLAVLLVPFHAS